MTPAMTTALDHFVPGQRVRAFWTNCNSRYEADGTITRVNAKTVRVDLDGSTVLWSGLDWTTDGRLVAGNREPKPCADSNTVIPFPGTPGNHVEAMAEASAEEIEQAKVQERARLNRKLDRFEGYAANAHRSAEAAKERSDALTDGIPLGQPILVDHYSARRHRRTLERAQNGMWKWLAENKRGDGWESRADGVEREMRRKGLA